MADKRWSGYDPELRNVPAINGTRTGGTRKPRTRGKSQPCISYKLDEDGQKTNIRAFSTPRTVKRKTRTVVVQPTLSARDRILMAKMGTIHGEA